MHQDHVVSRWFRWVLLLSLLATLALPPTTPVTAAPKSDQVEPGAGKWPTWVLKSGSELRPAAPPDQAATKKELVELEKLAGQRDAKALAQIAYWDAGAPNYRWIELALAQAQKKPMSNPRIDRMMAMMNIAIYDAMITAWDAKYTYNRARPTESDPKLTAAVAVPHSPAYPSEQAVAAGAASAILAYIYPDDAKDFVARAEEAAHSRLLAGVNYPSDVAAGLALGQAVAAKVIERAKSDGADAKWDGKMPTEAGHWTGEKPIEPLAGTWKTWALTSASQFRPPAPPAYDSAQEATELQEIQSYTRTWQSNQKALYWQSYDGIIVFWYDTASKRIFEHHLDANPPAVARIYALMSIAHYDAILACWDAKYTYWAMRPFQLDPKLVTPFPTPNHPSYPAAHGCASSAIAGVEEALFPAEAQYIHDKADEAGWSRLWAGIHFRSDIEAGLKLGRSVATLVIERAKLGDQ